MSTREELQPILDWWKLVGRVCVAIMPFAVTVWIFHGFWSGWRLGWALFNTWIGYLNFTKGWVSIETKNCEPRWAWTSLLMGCISLMVAGLNFVLLFS